MSTRAILRDDDVELGLEEENLIPKDRIAGPGSPLDFDGNKLILMNRIFTVLQKKN